jgi:hypothetical protein
VLRACFDFFERPAQAARLPALRCVFSAKAQKSLFRFLQGGFYRFEQHKTKKAL